MANLPLRRRKIPTGELPRTITEKWSRRILDEGYVPLPKRLLRSMNLIFQGEHALEDLAVVLAVADYRRPDLQRLPSVRYLAWNAGLTMEVFGRRLAALEKRGLVKREGSDEEINIELHAL